MRRSTDERRSSMFQRTSFMIQDSTARESTIAQQSPDNNFVAVGCLKGEECKEAPKSIHRLFEEMLNDNNSHETTALIYEDEGVPTRVTKYGELNSNANQIANLLLDTIKLIAYQPNQDGDFIIAVVAKPSDALITVLLGILKTGAAYMPIDPLYPKRRIEHILNDSKPMLIVYDDDFKNVEVFASFSTMKFGDIVRESSIMNSENIVDEKMFTKENEKQKAIICYTSGSTGAQKGVRISHFTLFHRITWQLVTFPFAQEEQNCVFKTSTSFIDHVGELWCPLVCGKTLIVVPRDVVINPDKFIKLLHEMEVQRLIIVPSMLRKLLMALKTIAASTKSKTMLANLRLWISSGEVLTKNLALDFFDYYTTKGENILVNFYGATEALDCTSYEIASAKQLENLNKIPIGLPVHNTIIYVIHRDTKEPAEEGESGEICVSGLTLADGYVNGHVRNAFVENIYTSHNLYQRLYRTGDYGSIRGGLLYYEGREDFQVKINGIRVDLQEISVLVDKLEYVHEAITLPFHPSQPDQTIICFVSMRKVFDKPIVKYPEDILNDLCSELIDYMIPKIFIVDGIPRLNNGKINQQQLLNQYENTLPKEPFKIKFGYDLKNISRDKQNVAKKVFETIGVALGNDAHMKINASSNFYRLGGNSMTTIATVQELRQKGYRVSMNEFLKARNINEIINHVSNNKSDNMKVKPDVKFIYEPFNALETSKCVQMLSTGYFEKNVLNEYLPAIKKDHYQELLTMHWDFFMRQNFSFMVKNVDDEVIGVTLICNVIEKPNEFPNTPVRHIFDFIRAIEAPIILNMISDSCLHVFMMGTSPSLNPHNTVALLRFMETKSIEVATKNNFKGILTTNTDPLTIEIGRDFGYRVMNEYRINRYTDKEGKKPFIHAPESQVVAVMYKSLK